MKLDEFRILTYEERAALLVAAIRFAHETHPDDPDKEIWHDLVIRIARLECQPGGCPLCTGKEEDYE